MAQNRLKKFDEISFIVCSKNAQSEYVKFWNCIKNKDFNYLEKAVTDMIASISIDSTQVKDRYLQSDCYKYERLFYDTAYLIEMERAARNDAIRLLQKVDSDLHNHIFKEDDWVSLSTFYFYYKYSMIFREFWYLTPVLYFSEDFIVTMKNVSMKFSSAISNENGDTIFDIERNNPNFELLFIVDTDVLTDVRSNLNLVKASNIEQHGIQIQYLQFMIENGLNKNDHVLIMFNY
jgi:hypothetical protein